MAMFKHDNQGFLVGELIETGRDMLKAQAQGMGIWKTIRTDVKSIARAVNVQVATTVRTSRPGARTPVARTATSSGGRTVGGNVVVPSGRSGGGQQRAATAGTRGSARTSVAVAVPQRAATPQRSASGRFIAGQKQGWAGDGLAFSGSGGGAVMNRLSDTLGKLSASMQATDNVDPTLNAAKELKDVVTPLGRGLFGLFGRNSERRKERKQDGWYTKIIKAITGKKSGEGSAQGAQDSSGFSISSLIAMLPMAAAVAPMLAAIGSAILTGLGLIGALSLGSFVGNKIYEWLDKSGILPKIFDAFDSIKAWFTGKVEGVKNDYQKGKEQALQTGPLPPRVGGDGRNVNDPRRVDQQPIEPPKSVAQAAGRVVGAFQRGQDYMAGQKGMVGRAAARWNGGAGDELTNAAIAAGTDPATMARIANFESRFNSDAAPIQNGKRLSSAHGYGQFLDGTWTDMLNKHGGKYGVANAGKLTTKDAGALRGDTKLQAAMLAEFTRENIAKGRALGGTDDSANAYAFHNLGGGDATKLMKALKANPNASVSSVLSSKVISNNKSLYGDGSISVSDAYKRMGSKMAEGDAYAADAVARASAIRGLTTVTPGAAVSARIPSMPSASVPSSVPANIPPPPDTPPHAQQLNSGSGAGRGMVVNVPNPLGQNVGDRGIAHIVSGGLGGA